jgi:branched-chain amino acid transport system substrate-binding protein
LLVAAIEKAGVVNGEAIAAAIPQVDVKGITGRIRISPTTHNPEGKDAAIIKIINGAYVFQQKYAAK